MTNPQWAHEWQNISQGFLKVIENLSTHSNGAHNRRKLSSINTSDEASRATSVPFSPMAIPILAALSAGASLTPSPVMATISLFFFFSAFTIFNFCSGTTRAKIFTLPMRLQSSSSDNCSSSLPVIKAQGFESLFPARYWWLSPDNHL